LSVKSFPAPELSLTALEADSSAMGNHELRPDVWIGRYWLSSACISPRTIALL
jgi:hypothetical protein